MIGDLPDLDDFFNSGANNNGGEEGLDLVEEQIKNHDYTINILISKEEGKWIMGDFIDIAVGGIGLHIMLPIQIELTSRELNNIKVKFVKKENDTEVTLKEVPALVRWQESDNLTGNLKLGLHFHGEVKSDEELSKILRELKDERHNKD